MKFIYNKVRLASASLLFTLLLSPAAFAGDNAFVYFGPTSYSPVPALSDSVLIVLGLLMAVIAFRTLHAQRGAGKIFGIVLMAGALTLGGFGVERSVATSEHTVAGDECTNGGSHSFFPRENDFTNSCSVPIQILRYENCPVVNRCLAGTVLAPGQVCVLPSCGFDET